jgi:hypothetical protein
MSTIIILHGEYIEVDNMLVELIIYLNLNKLITRGSCENWNNTGREYILFDYFDFVNLLKTNPKIKIFIKDNCNFHKPYYAQNNLREITIKKGDKLISDQIWCGVDFKNDDIPKFLLIIKCQ